MIASSRDRVAMSVGGVPRGIVDSPEGGVTCGGFARSLRDDAALVEPIQGIQELVAKSPHSQMVPTYSPRKFAPVRSGRAPPMSATARPKARYEACARCCFEIRPKMSSRPIPFEDYGQRTLPPDAVRHRDEQLLRLDAEARAAVGDRLHAGLPHNCLKIVEDEIAALEASTLSSAVVGSPSRCRLEPARCRCPAGTEHTWPASTLLPPC